MHLHNWVHVRASIESGRRDRRSLDTAAYPVDIVGSGGGSSTPGEGFFAWNWIWENYNDLIEEGLDLKVC